MLSLTKFKHWRYFSKQFFLGVLMGQERALYEPVGPESLLITHYGILVIRPAVFVFGRPRSSKKPIVRTGYLITQYLVIEERYKIWLQCMGGFLGGRVQEEAIDSLEGLLELIGPDWLLEKLPDGRCQRSV